MEPESEREFDDHVLKAAVRRCWAGECAPTELRQKAAGLLNDTARGPVAGGIFPRRTAWVMWPIAAAAVMVLSMALFYRLHPSAPGQTASLIPVSLQSDLIATHDQCCKSPNHQHLKVPRDNDAAIADALHAQLNRPMLVARPIDPGWTFRGASICPVGTIASGHLVFVKGENSLSIFSLPVSILPGATEGGEYVATIDQHTIVGFVKDGALFCLVGSGPPGTVDVKDLQTMRKQMESAVALLPPSRSNGIVLAELLHPVAR